MQNLVDVLAAHASDERHGVHVVDAPGPPRSLSYGALWREALRVLAVLRQRGLAQGDEVVVQLHHPLDFLVAVWAAFLGGMVPVPVGIARHAEQARLLTGILERLSRPVWLGDGAPPAGGRTLRWADVASERAAAATPVAPAPEDVALVQFSSGSTGDPKGVVLTHRNLVANTGDIARRVPFTPADRTLSWMPLTHDMGLIGMHLAPLIGGADQYVLTPATFLKQPERWIEAASEVRATVLATANFGLEHVLRSGVLRLAGAIDLSSVLTIGIGSDPIAPATCRAFVRALARFGLRASAIYPIYGLSEATVGVTFPDPGRGAVVRRLARASIAPGARVVDAGDGAAQDAIELVEVGHALDHTRLRIAGPDGVALGDAVVGAIEVQGDNVARRYHGAADGSTLRDGWLPTGDLGFLRDGQLVITGRAKDVFFVAGQNVYLHDVDRIARWAALRDAGACVVRDGQHERLVVGVRFDPAREAMRQGRDPAARAPDVFAEVARKVGAALASEAGVPGVAVVPVERLPKTTSGKLRRHELALAVAAALRSAAPAEAHDVPAGVVREVLAARLGADDLERPGLLAELPSIVIVELAAALSERLGRDVAPRALFDHPDVAALTRLLAPAGAALAPAAAPAPSPAASPSPPRFTVRAVGPGPDEVDEATWLGVPARVHDRPDADHDAVREAFDPALNAAFAGGAAARWVACDEAGRPVGRIAAFGRRGQSVAGFGFFACSDDHAVAAALFDAAAAFAVSALGATDLEGPTNFGERDRFAGLLVEGCERPLPLENDDPAYAAALVLGCGFTPAFESYTYHLDLERLPLERLGATRAAVTTVELAPDDPRFLDVLEVYRASFDPRRRIHALEHAEVRRRIAARAATTTASRALVAYRDGAPVGFIAWLDDPARGVKVYGLAVHPEARLIGVDAALLADLARGLRARGHREAFVAGVASYSTRVVRALEDVLGARRVRRHVTYRRDLTRG